MNKTSTIATLCTLLVATTTGPAFAAQACQKSLNGRWRVVPSTQLFHKADAINDPKLIGRVLVISATEVRFGKRVLCQHPKQRLTPIETDKSLESPDPHPIFAELSFKCVGGGYGPQLSIGEDCNVIHWIAQSETGAGRDWISTELKRVN